MFVGHGVLAFAIAVGSTRWRGWSRDRALAVGLLAFGFATLPDVDMVYALVGVAGNLGGLGSAAAGFWDAAAVTHRSVTHSLVLGVALAVAAALWRGVHLPGRGPGTRRSRLFAGRLLGLGIALALVGVVAVRSGPLDGAIAVLFAGGGLALAHLGGRLHLDARSVLGAATLGLVSHPFGDLFTGAPPPLLYPLDVTVLGARLAPFADPTVTLLVPFFLELATLWLGLFALAHLRGWRLQVGVDPTAGLGVGYAAAVVALPAPTLETASPFVFSVLAVGLVALPVGIRGPRPRHWRLATTALAAVTVAGVAYLAAYHLVG